MNGCIPEDFETRNKEPNLKVQLTQIIHTIYIYYFKVTHTHTHTHTHIHTYTIVTTIICLL